MSQVLRVRWTIVPQTAPQPWRPCSRCGGARRFRTGGKARVNANGRRVDAWLIYRCTACDGTWNRPILERRPLRAIDPAFLGALVANDPELMRRLAFDVEALRRRGGRVELFDDVVVTRDMPSESVPAPTGLRLDRLLGNELRLSRSVVRRLESRGALVVSPPGSRLHRPVRDGMEVGIDLSSPDAAGIFPTDPDF